MFIYFFPFFSNHSPLFHRTSTTYTLSPTNVSRIFFSFLCFFFSSLFLTHCLYFAHKGMHLRALCLRVCLYVFDNVRWSRVCVCSRVLLTRVDCVTPAPEKGRRERVARNPMDPVGTSSQFVVSQTREPTTKGAVMVVGFEDLSLRAYLLFLFEDSTRIRRIRYSSECSTRISNSSPLQLVIPRKSYATRHRIARFRLLHCH